MRFPSAMRLSLLVFFALSPPSALSTRATLVDVLSQHSQFSSLLHLLQRARLIPTLNRLSNATFFAPTNDAIEKWNTEHPEPTDPDDGNINESLRQHLFYHLLNYTLDDIAPQLPVPLETLLFPEVPLELPSPSPPPSPPWLPVPGGLLNSEGQRLRIVLRAGESFVGVDAFGRGGSQIIKRHLTASNGLVLPIDEVIPAPTDLATTIANHPILSTFNSFLTKELKNTLSTAPHLTLFFPLDSAWDALDPIERLYLDSGFAEKDIERLVAFHSVNDAGIDGHGSVGWTESWTDGQKLTTPEGNELRIGFSPDGSIQINEATVVQPDIYASNGVLHLVTDLLFPEGSFKLNVEKSLLALNCTQFVSLLRSADLSHYVDDDHDGQPWTILAPRDDVFSFFTESESETETQLSIETKPPIFPDLKRSLKYHILPGIVNPKDLQDGMLIGTELREVGLGGGRQQLIVSVGGKGGTITHGKHGNGEIGFGGGMVIGEPGNGCF
jgi:solute carrier family 25 carnitine/acylcarnitine transporter 20/29